ncbi:MULTISPECIES: hypothetical protein [unclassified Streptomyces]|uniref:hypothetical protein n=1 Tax=unclassified Streptomyces TaxID=2593676 RepID=UPI0038300346
MSERENENTGQSTASAGTDPDCAPPGSAPPEPVAPRPARRRRIAAVAGAAVLALAVVAGVATTVVTVRGADRDPGKPTWKFPKSDGKETPVAQRGLAGMLVPYGGDGGWTRGPDMEEFGADALFTGAQAAAVQKRSFGDLPRTQRRELEKRVDKLRIRGIAMRSYYNHDVAVYNREDVYAVRVSLTQMDSATAVRDLVRAQNAFLEGAAVFREGPAVKDHKNARCFLPAKDAESDIGVMLCAAAVGDVAVAVSARGPRPFDTKDVAEFVRTQLDRIAEPGEAV